MTVKYLVIKDEIAEELAKLEKLVKKILDAKQKYGGSEVYTDFAAVNLQAYYTGIERIFRKVAKKIDGGIPESERWHKDLLEQVAIEIPQVRPAVITKSLRDELLDYLAFRHLIRNVYPFDIDEKRVDNLLAKLPTVHGQLSQELSSFCSFLGQAGNQT
jgi:hypothetical protein